MAKQSKTKTSQPEDISGANPIKLALAWSFVGIPLLWGVYKTLTNAVLLFQ